MIFYNADGSVRATDHHPSPFGWWLRDFIVDESIADFALRNACMMRRDRPIRMDSKRADGSSLVEVHDGGEMIVAAQRKNWEEEEAAMSESGRCALHSELGKIQRDFQACEAKLTELIKATKRMRYELIECNNADEILLLLQGDFTKIKSKDWPFKFSRDYNLII